MSNIDKQALREEFQYMQDHYSDPADRDRQIIYISRQRRCWTRIFNSSGKKTQ